jgi:preprotein translocase subunit SecF
MSFQIIKNRKYTFIISSILVISSIILLFTFGLKKGIDFTGGSLLEVKFVGGAPSSQDVVSSLETLGLGKVVAQSTDGDKMFIKMSFLNEDDHQRVLDQISDNFGSEPEVVLSEDGEVESMNGGITVSEERFETIGASISSHLKNRSWSASVAVIIAIVLYIAYTFRKIARPVASWKFGVAAIVALVHDTLIVMGLFALLGHLYGVEVDISFVVALLTIMGYSVNDTIIIFDRVRENLIKRGTSNFDMTVNDGVNQSISRSINTAFTTLLVLFALLLFGGDSIHYFALALIVGIVVGTYSSIFIASPLLVEWQKLSDRKKK